MISVNESLKKKKLQARMLLQIHDELVFEAPQEELPELEELVRTCMEKRSICLSRSTSTSTLAPTGTKRTEYVNDKW